MRVTIRHTTSFTYPQPARASFNELRLTPRNDEGQNLISFGLTLEPPARTTQFRDHWGTLVQAFNINAPHDHLTIVGESRVVTSRRPPLPDSTGDAGGTFDALDEPALRDALAESLHSSPLAGGGEPLSTFAQHVRQVVAPHSVLALVEGISREVHARFTYVSGTSYVSSTVDDLLKRGTGVCQDFAHLMIATLRDLGIPARYVSGYFYAGHGEPAPDVALEVESHAWVEAYVPGTGWIAYDPTNDCPADERHVTVAVGRDYSDVPPVRGTLLGGRGQQLDVAVTMVAPSSPFPVTPTPSASGWRAATHQAARRDPLATLQSEQQQQ
ncbi:MAG TPA: transglutaminase family protein [Mycobacteriales bacterium]